MTRTLNKVMLIGRLGADPETRFITSGVQVTTFSLATNRQWNDKEGVSQEETEWHTIVTWDRLAQVCGEHLSKGRLVYVEGRLHTRSWEQNGQKVYKTEVVASDMLILDSKGAQAPVEQTAEPVAVASTPRNGAKAARSRTPVPVRDEEDLYDPEDLPF